MNTVFMIFLSIIPGVLRIAGIFQQAGTLSMPVMSQCRISGDLSPNMWISGYQLLLDR